LQVAHKECVGDKTDTDIFFDFRFLQNFGEFLQNSVGSPKFRRAIHRYNTLLCSLFRLQNIVTVLRYEASHIFILIRFHVPDGATLRDHLSFDCRMKTANITQKPTIAAKAIDCMISVYMASSK
jgi:hypothetical protein